MVSDNARKATDRSAFTVSGSAAPGHISYTLSVPSISRPGRIAYLTLTYSNDGGSDALAPLFVVAVASGNAKIGLPGETSFTGSSVQILGIENSGPAGTLPPGFQGTIQIPYQSTTLTQGASINFSLQVLTGDSTPMNWSSLESSLQPSYIPNAAWPAVFANLTGEFGSTTSSYLTYLDSEATYLSGLGEYADDVQRLFGFGINTANDALTSGSIDSVTDASFPVPGAIPFEFDRQFNASISGRDTMGPFGLGWTDNWQISASADSSGNVTVSDDGSLLFFTKNSDGSFARTPGEFGTLSLTSGAYQYVQTDGTIIVFNTNGSLNYEQDTNGNRITAGYNSSGELSSLTASNGSALKIAYNAQGLIASITDPSGQTTHYTYDPSGQHLLTFTDVFGKTTYTYAAGPSAADANALTTLTFADGTGLEWSYDAEGRMATAGRLGRAETVTYSYPAPGESTATDADGNKTAIFHDDFGDLGETIDPLGNITRNTFDANHDLVKTVAADGTTTTFAYDDNGNMTSETDALGQSIFFTYNSLAEPLTFVNQQGFTTSYQYDAHGNLLETTNPDGTTQQDAYNGLGEVTSSTDADGQVITYGYNANAQLTTENLPDGTSNTYTFDSHGNMLTASGPGGDWTFTYNSQNLPTTIAEPNGTLTVKYGIDGNLTQIVDQTGFTTNYLYDAVGRLSKLTDASGTLIESYSYDPAGNVISEIKGNGTSTTYHYNGDGETTEITNLAPGGSINSQMAYAYNAVGEVTSMATGGVTTAYGYDADGELVSASSPGDTIQYAYDRDGNRTSVTDNGVVTDYVSNDVNEYTSTTTTGVTTSYQYDANGNLISATASGVTTSYTFDAINQLTGVSGPNETFSYAYDPLGYQISSTVNGQTTNNLIDPFGLGNVAAQFDVSGDLVAHYTYGLGLVSQVNASGTSDYYDYNLQGSTVGITNASGAYVNQYNFGPFGQVTTISAGIANPFTFVGQYGVSTDGSGLIYMRNRYFDPSIGRFVSNDPRGLKGHDANILRYSANDPIRLGDPSGEGWIQVSYSVLSFLSAAIILAAQFTNPIPPGPAPDGRPIPTPQQGPEPSEPTPFEEAQNIADEAFVEELEKDAEQGIADSGGLEGLEGLEGMEGIGWFQGIEGLEGLSDVEVLGALEGLGELGLDGLGALAAAELFLPAALALGGLALFGYWFSQNFVSHDPNDVIGPGGYGSGEFITAGGSLGYTIEYSNEKTAQVPADDVVLTEQLSTNFDWNTFQFGTIGFGNYVVSVPAGLTSYSTRVDAKAALGVYVDVDARLNLTTGLLTVTYTSLDPNTFETPSNPLVCFLPPDTNPPNGEGYITYTIQPKAGLATGSTLDAQASIVFDTNAAIATPEITNTIDASPPTSTVAALPPTTSSTNFTVSWSGTDGAGPGIADYNVYVSDDGGGFIPWQANTTATTATYTGQAGHMYRFYSVATDNVGLVQPTPTAPQAAISVVNTATPTSSPLVTVQSLRAETIKVGTGKKAKKETVLVLHFSGALDAGAADNASAYEVAPVITVKGKGKGKHKQPPTTKLGTPVTPSLAAYTGVNNQVTLTPRGALNLTKPEELIVNGKLLTDAQGREIDGNDDGQPGGDYIATVSGSRVTAGGLPRARTSKRSTAVSGAIDALLARGELAEVTRSLRATARTEHLPR